MAQLPPSFVKQRLCVEFAALKYACPKGIYVAPLPDEPLTWTGVFFPRKGPYANAILRFHVDFGASYPVRPPVIRFSSDVFHPLVTPLTTYTHTTRDADTETVSSADKNRLPPGGFVLKHGFPEWFAEMTGMRDGHGPARDADRGQTAAPECADDDLERLRADVQPQPHIVEVLQYLRVAFDTEAVIDSIPLDVAANSGAWHAWKTYRSKLPSGRASPALRNPTGANDVVGERSTSPRQQPGGARRPGEWNWQGVWEDRVKKSILTSHSEQVLFGGDGNDVINFLKMDPETAKRQLPFAPALVS
ncbi:MAG: hypothetical protein FE78DRAFT_74806 [Acidomyces sp. 'richmondensis']|nr:MAG: hypothetical protein FE78DRAFT_74806 [Acidomyces sp. 'richmondensis']